MVYLSVEEEVSDGVIYTSSPVPVRHVDDTRKTQTAFLYREVCGAIQLFIFEPSSLLELLKNHSGRARI